MPFGQLNVTKYKLYVKGVLGLGGERGCISERRHQMSDKKKTTLQDGRFYCTSTVYIVLLYIA